jgi:cell division protein FtsX
MKKQTILVLFALIITVTLLSQTSFGQEKFKKTPEERAQNRTEKLTKNLGLSDEQQKQVYSILYSHAAQVDVLRSNQDMSKEARKDQMKNLRKELNASLTGIFNSEQNEKWNKFKEAKKQKHMDKKKHKKQNKGSKKQK